MWWYLTWNSYTRPALWPPGCVLRTKEYTRVSLSCSFGAAVSQCGGSSVHDVVGLWALTVLDALKSVSVWVHAHVKTNRHCADNTIRDMVRECAYYKKDLDTDTWNGCKRVHRESTTSQKQHTPWFSCLDRYHLRRRYMKQKHQYRFYINQLYVNTLFWSTSWHSFYLFFNVINFFTCIFGNHSLSICCNCSARQCCGNYSFR